MSGETARPWSPVEAEVKLGELLSEIDESVVNLASVAVQSARAEHAYKVQEAREYTKLRAMGITQADSNKRALLAVEQEHLDHVLAEAVARSSYKRVDLLKAQLDGVRSLLVSARGVS